MSTVPSPALDAELALRGAAVLPAGLAPDALVLVADGRIRYAGPAAAAPAHRASLTREHDGLLLPGLVDLHCHGGGGASFPDSATTAEMLTAVHEHRRHGTTSPCPPPPGRSPASTARGPSSPWSAAVPRTPSTSWAGTRISWPSSPSSRTARSRP